MNTRILRGTASAFAIALATAGTAQAQEPSTESCHGHRRAGLGEQRPRNQAECQSDHRLDRRRGYRQAAGQYPGGIAAACHRHRDRPQQCRTHRRPYSRPAGYRDPAEWPRDLLLGPDRGNDGARRHSGRLSIGIAGPCRCAQGVFRHRHRRRHRRPDRHPPAPSVRF